ncbi:MAG: zinc dependent phospholipase C family protein [Defluviitaleaceae bacterium]|nr:zinc dependent phospholipase C family protein [Defluviitaleaceae bacterium]
MPGFLTHYIAGKALLQGLDPQVQKPLLAGERLYNLGTQGPDIFFYYFPGQLRKRSRGVGSQMHVSNLGLFLVEMARQARESGREIERDTIFSYTSGFLMHYALDAHTHPYVYAMTHNSASTGLRNSADHRKFETAIDVAMLNLVSGQKPAMLKQWELINADSRQMAIAASALSQAVREIYKRDVPPKVVHRAMRHMVHLTRLLQSSKGRRKRWMELVENLTVREPIFSSMVHMPDMADERDYLNTQKSPWIPPWQNDSFTDSFLERYNAAVEEGIELVELLYKYVYSSLSAENLAQKIGNRSLKTGLPCNDAVNNECDAL